MKDTLFGRKYNVTIGNRRLSSDEFTIYFDIPFDDGPNPNIAEIEIYNLKDSTINLIKEGQKVILNAGYQSDVGTILDGVVRMPETEWKRVDKVTTIHVLDGNDDWMEKQVKKTYKEDVTGKQILTDLLKLSGLKTGSFVLPLNMVYKNGKTIKDTVGKAIVDIAQDCNAKVHVNRGKIFIREKAKGDNRGFILDRSRGLIGSPTPIEKKEEYNVAKKVEKKTKKNGKTVVTYETEYQEKSKTRRGWKVVSLMHHRITTDSIIKISSNTANGLFRVEKGRHYCNGSSYYTEIECFPI